MRFPLRHCASVFFFWIDTGDWSRTLSWKTVSVRGKRTNLESLERQQFLFIDPVAVVSSSFQVKKLSTSPAGLVLGMLTILRKQKFDKHERDFETGPLTNHVIYPYVDTIPWPSDSQNTGSAGRKLHFVSKSNRTALYRKSKCSVVARR